MGHKAGTSRYEDVVRVIHMVHGFTGMLAVSVVIRAANKLATIMLAVITASLVEHVISSSVGSLLWWIVGMGSSLLGIIVLSYSDTYVSHDISFKIIKILRDTMYDHMDKIAPGGLEGRNSADTAMIILSDIEVFEWFYAHCLVEWIGTFMTLLVCVVLLSIVSIPAAATVIIGLVVMMLVPFFSMERAKQKGLIMKRLYGALNGIVADGVSGSKDIIAFHWIKNFFERLGQTEKTYSEAQIQFAKRSECEKTAEAIIACITILISLSVCAFNLKAGGLPQLIPIFALLVSAVECVQGSLSEGTNFGFVFGAAGRMVSVLDIKAPVEDTGTKQIQDVAVTNGEWILTLQNVGFHYSDGTQVLKDISFEAKSPETIAIVAASGGGKSTIGKLLQRFWDPSDGAILVNGVNIRELTLDTLREIITVVPQETYLFSGSIRDNLALAKPYATDAEIESVLNAAQATAFVQRLDRGADTNVGENGVMLSGGERQRLALSQALLKDPPILVLDEATSALDTENERRINEAIKKSRGAKITLLIAHRVSSMKAADRIVFIQDGSVYAMGSYDELMRTCCAFKNLVRGAYLEEENQ